VTHPEKETEKEEAVKWPIEKAASEVLPADKIRTGRNLAERGKASRKRVVEKILKLVASRAA